MKATEVAKVASVINSTNGEMEGMKGTWREEREQEEKFKRTMRVMNERKEEGRKKFMVRMGLVATVLLTAVSLMQQGLSLFLLLLMPFVMVAVYSILFLGFSSTPRIFGVEGKVKEKIVDLSAIVLWVIFLLLSFTLILMSTVFVMGISMTLAPFVGPVISVSIVTIIILKAELIGLLITPPEPPTE